MPVIKVSQLSLYISNLLKRDRFLANVKIEGEISNLSYSSGLIFFNLKDDFASISAIVFRDRVDELSKYLVEGKKVVVTGSVSTYERASRYQIIVDDVEEAGKGKIYQAYLKLKKDLDKEGLFDIEHKKSIPSIPSKIGLISSKNGAAAQDVINVVKRRFPQLSIYFYPSLVQGASAADNVIRAIDYLDNKGLDLILITRGGGSFEDLFEFSSEKLVRRVYSAKTPIVAAIGHQVDESLVELAADLRAATPTEAAELVTPRQENLRRELDQAKLTLDQAMIKLFDKLEIDLSYMAKDLGLLNPLNLIEEKKESLRRGQEKINNIIKDRIKDYDYRLNLAKTTLDKYDSKKILDRGYAIVLKDKGTVNSINKVDLGEELRLILGDGNLLVNVKDKVANEDKS